MNQRLVETKVSLDITEQKGTIVTVKFKRSVGDIDSTHKGKEVIYHYLSILYT